jgi:IS4 transposase
MGIRGKVSRSTLAEANQQHDWRIFADFAQILIGRARTLYSDDPFGEELRLSAFALDSTTIDLCLALFPWARFRQSKGAVKMHTLLDLHGNIPTCVWISNGKLADVKILDQLVVQAGSFYVMDRGYVDFQRLHRITKASAFFVTRTKDNIKLNRRYSRPVDPDSGVRSDHIVVLATANSRNHYPDALRRIRYYDAETKRYLVFLTNNFELPALTISKLYKARWQVELFFKWVKQHLRIKAFYGTSMNAVKTQIWIAITTYVLISIAKKELGLSASIYQILQVVSVTVFERVPIPQALQCEESEEKSGTFSNQLNLFNL